MIESGKDLRCLVSLRHIPCDLVRAGPIVNMPIGVYDLAFVFPPSEFEFFGCLPVFSFNFLQDLFYNCWVGHLIKKTTPKPFHFYCCIDCLRQDPHILHHQSRNKSSYDSTAVLSSNFRNCIIKSRTSSFLFLIHLIASRTIPTHHLFHLFPLLLNFAGRSSDTHHGHFHNIHRRTQGIEAPCFRHNEMG